MRTGVVLGAGGLTGQAFHLGVLTALHAHGWDARRTDVLVGSSAGALVAAGLAGGLSAADLAAELTGEPQSAEGQALRAERRGLAGPTAHRSDSGPAAVPGVVDLPGATTGLRSAAAAAASRLPLPLAPLAVVAAARRPWAVRPAALVSSLLPAGRVETEPIARGIRHLHGAGWPDRDLRICVIRARDARRVVLGTPGAPAVDIGTAVAASCAIPSYFAPVRAAGETWVDGGMHTPTNADVLVGDRLDLVVVVSPMSMARPRSRLPRRPPVDLAVRVWARRLLAAEVRRLRRTGTRVVVLQPEPADAAVMGANPMRGTRLEEIVEQAAASTAERLDTTPDLLSPHRR